MCPMSSYQHAERITQFWFCPQCHPKLCRGHDASASGPRAVRHQASCLFPWASSRRPRRAATLRRPSGGSPASCRATMRRRRATPWTGKATTTPCASAPACTHSLRRAGSRPAGSSFRRAAPPAPAPAPAPASAPACRRRSPARRGAPAVVACGTRSTSCASGARRSPSSSLSRCSCRGTAAPPCARRARPFQRPRPRRGSARQAACSRRRRCFTARPRRWGCTAAPRSTRRRRSAQAKAARATSPPPSPARARRPSATRVDSWPWATRWRRSASCPRGARR